MSEREGEIQDLHDRLELAGLGRFASALIGLSRPGVRLVADGTASGDRASRLGGLPELPDATAWPRVDGAPLSFVAQIDLAQVSPFDTEGLLPADGLLSFFYDAVTQQAWGFDPADHGAAAVLYTPVSEHTRYIEPPGDLAADGTFTPIALRPKAEMSLPPWESYDVERLAMSRAEKSGYAELFAREDDLIHRLLGHPDPIQGDMQLECQLVTNGLYCGDPSGYQDPRVKNLQAGASDWRLLLQIDSEEQAGMMWGDVGRIYYWIKATDLVARDWELCWLILQCG